LNDTKKTKLQQAIALHYDGHGAPKVTAKGKGTIAEQILAVAEENGIPLHEDPDLVTLLSGLELGDEIPPTLYMAVAEVLAHIHYLSLRHGDEDQ